MQKIKINKKKKAVVVVKDLKTAVSMSKKVKLKLDRSEITQDWSGWTNYGLSPKLSMKNFIKNC